MRIPMRLPMRLSIPCAAAAALAAAAIVPGPAARAQVIYTSPNPATPPSATAPSPETNAAIPSETLDHVAQAMKNVTSIKEQYAHKMAGASPPDRERIADEATSAIMKAITDQGLSVDQYSAVLQVAQNDPKVRQELIQRIVPNGQAMPRPGQDTSPQREQ